jgi:hypothetical protein
MRKIRKQVACFEVKDLCSHGNAYSQVRPIVSRSIRTLPVQTAISNMSRVIPKVQQRIQRGFSHDEYVAAPATIATRGAALRHKLFTSEGSYPVTSIAPFNMNLCPINKHQKSKTTPRRARLCAGSGVVHFPSEFLGSRLLRWIDANKFSASAFVLKLHDAIDEREQRIVLTSADVVTWFPPSPTLARNDVATQDAFASKLLESQTLRMRIAAISG